MKYARLVWVNLLRNKLRTLLTVLSVCVALFLFSTLRSVITALDAATEVGSEARLMTLSATGITFLLPQAHYNRLEAVEGVRSVSWANWFGGIYIDESNFFAQFAVDAESYFAMYPEMRIPEDQMEAFMAERTAAIVGNGLMRRFGWSVGQQVVLQGTFLAGDWEFTIRGVYTPDDPSFGEELFYLHYDYMYEGSGRRMTPGWFILQLDDPTEAAAISQRIDAMFENSSNPTKTQTEKALNAEFINMFGNVGQLVRTIGLAVFFAILLVAANTMMMAARERINEHGVLKALGFQNGQLFGIVLAESVVITVIGGVMGIALASYLFRPGNFMTPYIPGFVVQTQTQWLGLVIAALLGIVSGLVPAWQAARLSVVQALRRVA
jgi:putative ABC transport system permease protein